MDRIKKATITKIKNKIVKGINLPVPDDFRNCQLMQIDLKSVVKLLKIA